MMWEGNKISSRFKVTGCTPIPVGQASYRLQVTGCKLVWVWVMGVKGGFREQYPGEWVGQPLIAKSGVGKRTPINGA